MTDHEADILALAHWRDRQRAETLTIDIGLAAELNPEILRKAIGKVFDVSALEESQRRLMLALADAQAKLAHMADLLREGRQEFEELRARMFRVQEWLSKRSKAIQANGPAPTQQKATTK